MTDNPLLTICCTTYNHEPYIRQCLDGFMMQQCEFRFEVLIHDDASTDGTAKIVMEYEKKYPDQIRGIYQTENQWSKGIRPSPTYVWPSAKGKYIALCEGDDYWTDPFKLQKQVSFLEHNPEYVLTGGYAKQIYEKEGYNVVHDRPNYTRDFDFDTRFLFLENPLSTLTVCFRNGLIKQFPQVYFTGMGGDRRLYMLLSQHGRCRYIHEPWGVYRIHDGGITSKYRKDWEGRLKGLEEGMNNASNWNAYFDHKYDAEVLILQHRLALRAIKLCMQNNSLRRASFFLDRVDFKKLTIRMRIVYFFLKLIKL